jgi:hypothetical protein
VELKQLTCEEEEGGAGSVVNLKVGTPLALVPVRYLIAPTQTPHIALGITAWAAPTCCQSPAPSAVVEIVAVIGPRSDINKAGGRGRGQ